MIYFIKEDSPEGYIKIGYTANTGRLQALNLQIGNPRRLWVMGTLHGEQDKERELHVMFSHARVAGEWFHPTPDLLQYISDNCEDTRDSPHHSSGFWKRGEQTTLALEAGISRSLLNDMLTGRKNPSVKKAKVLEEISRRTLGEDRSIPAAAWLRLEKHPALERGA